MIVRLLTFVLLVSSSFVSLAQKETRAFFRYNLAGYLSKDEKKALVLSEVPLKGSFVVLESPSGKQIFKGQLKTASGNYWKPFSHYYEADFTSLEKDGNYIIRLDNGSGVQSGLVTIGKYPDYQNYLVAFMRQQRCGYNPYTKQVCHKHDGLTFYSPLPDSSYLDASGGWHDAGDQLKYLITSSNATARLLLAYEWQKKQLNMDKVDDLGHPVSNGIPDVLDEAKWGLEWIHKLHPQPDHLYHQVADDRDHKGFKYPHQDNANYGWGANSYRPVYFATGKPQGLGKYQSEATGIANLAGRSAAAMAIAARIWKQDLQDTIYSARCLKAALELYALGRKKEGYQQGNHYNEMYRYYEDTWADDMEWAAAELYKVTKKPEFLTDAKKYAKLIGTTSWMEVDTAKHYQLYPFVNLGHYTLYDVADEVTKKEVAEYYRHNLTQIAQKGLKNPYNIGVPFIWCSNNLVVAFVTQALLYERMTGDKQFRPAMLHHRDWLLGKNPWGTSMFTGFPEKGDFPLDVHLPLWILEKKVIPGGLVDGPLWQTIHGMMRSLKLNEADEYARFQPPHVKYHDDMGDYSTNEPTMDGTADALFILAAFNE